MNSIISKVSRIATILLASTALVACDFFSSGSGDHIPTPVISVSPEDATLYVGMEITLSAANSTDQDGDQLSYVWSQPEGQAIALNPTESDTNVTVNFIADAAGSYTFILTVSDGKYENSTEISLDILVDEANEPPVFTSSSEPISVSENTTEVIYTATATDPEGDTLTYSLAGSDAEAFSIDASSGALSFASAPNFEAPTDADSDNTYQLSLQASDGNSIVSQALSISVTNVDEAPTITSAASADVAENSTGTIHTAAASDPEEDTLTYSLGGTDSGHFSINSSSGALSFSSSPDFEAPIDENSDNTYELTISVTDSSANTSSQALTIVVTDANDNIPVITANQSFADVSEGSTGGTELGAVSATDADAGTTFQSWTITGGNSAGDFAIDSASGTLRVASGASLDFESKPNYTLQLTVQDDDGANTSDVAELSISIADINEAPTFTSATTELSVVENAAGVIYTAAASDVDADDTQTYSIVGGADKDLFTMNGADLSFIEAPDYESGTITYAVTIRVTDSGDLSADLALSISITDVNEAPTFASASASATAPENSTDAFYIAAATDLDAGASISYSLASGVADNDLFSITSDGALSLQQAQDYEAGDGTYEVKISASDGELSAATNLTLSVTLEDVNEAPAFVSTSDSATVSENSTGAFYTAAATDPDAGASIAYSLASGVADNDLFSISSDGALSLQQALDYETDSTTYTVRITASDGSLSAADLELTVTLNGVDEQPSFTSAASVEVNENTDTGTIVYTATASDPEGSNSLSYAIVAGSDIGAFQPITSAGNQGTIRFDSIPNFESPADANDDNTYELTISVSDGTTDPVTQAITIVVADVDEAPTITSAETEFTVPENTTSSFHTVTATDPENTTLNYSLSGADANELAIDSSGALSFANTPDFEAPTDDDGANVYSVTLEVSDGTNTDTQDLTITVTGVDEAPTINNTASSVLFTENATGTVFDASATDPENATLIYSLSGDDATDLSIDSDGLITFNSSPDYDIPADADTNNYYLITIAVSDGTNSVSQALTIEVTDVNEAPTITNTNTAVSTAEDTVNNPSAFEYAIAATDPEGEALSYALGGADATDFAVDSDGVVTFKSGQSGTGYDPNFEHPADADGNNVYQLDLYAQDASGITSSYVSIAITVTDEPEAPTFANLSAEASVSENTSSVFYLAEASDDDGDSVSYSLASGEDNGLFTISSTLIESVTYGELSFSSAPDYEIPTDSDNDGIYNVTITASDGSLSSNLELAVTVTDVNEAPAFASASASTTAPENSTDAFYTAAASDPEEDSLSYSLASGVADNDFFSITTSGELRFLEAQDREAAANDANTDYTYEVQITASDGTYSTETALSLSVTLENVNEAPTVTNTVTAISVVEDTNSSPVSFQYTITASDPENDSLVYSISGTDAAAFDVDPSTGLITFKAGVSGTPYDPNYEYPSDAGGDNLYQLEILASDSTLDSSLVAIEVSVTDVSAAPNFVNSSGASLGSGDNFADSASFAENGTGAAYTAITVDDDDTDDFVKYHITGGVDSDLFEITNDQTGEIFFKSSPDYELAQDDDEDNTYIVEVNATDSNDTTVITLSITIDNLNDNAPVVAAQTLDIDEDAANGSTVGAVAVTDADATSGLATTYSAWAITGGNTNSAFAIDASGTITVADTSQIDYESGTTSYSLSVSVSDGDNTGTGTVTVNINDTNDEAPVINSASPNLAENASANDLVATLTATDPDTGLATTLQSWTIASGNTDGIFTLNPTTGALTVADTTDLDYDVGAQSYSLLVTVSDGTNTSAEQTITVTITDVNDITPSINSGQVFTIREDALDGTEVDTVAYSDADTGNVFTWSILSGNDDAAFAIGEATGTITVNDTSKFSFGSPGSYSLALQLEDGVNTSATETVTISIGESIVPTDFVATGDLAKVILTWTEVSGITYDIYRSTDASCDVLTHFNSSSCTDGQLYNSATTGMEDTGLAAETTYYYWIQATRSSDSTTQASLTPISATTIAMGVLNDTGMYYAGKKDRLGNQTDCSIDTNTPENQDCHNGRDATHPDSSDGYYGFSFTKLDSDGAELDASAGSWSCVLDNVTGLIWEVKTDDGGLRDKDNTYKWGGITAIGRDHESREGDYYDDWNTLVDAANTENGTGLCGYTDWRVANVSELFSLADYGYYIRSTSGPSIDQNYFPNTVANSYISATPDALDNSRARHFNFYYTGDVGSLPRDSQYHVRLVRSDN